MKMIPSVLTIAGSDSGGGAGIQADLKTFQSLGVFGTSAITCITAQNPSGVFGIMEVDSLLLEKQISVILEYFPIQFAKSGMLFSKDIVQVVIQIIKKNKVKLICDPVMIATSGAKLLKEDAVKLIKEELIPLSYLITPNSDEAALLLNKEIKNAGEMEDASRELYNLLKVPVLLKGGHLKENKKLKDVLYDGKELSVYPSDYIEKVSTHGTGCTYSSAITAYSALGYDLKTSVLHSKSYLHNTILNSYNLGKSTSLNHSIFIKEN